MWLATPSPYDSFIRSSSPVDWRSPRTRTEARSASTGSPHTETARDEASEEALPLLGNQAGGVYLFDADLNSRNDTIASNGAHGILMTGTVTSTAWLSNTIVWGHTWSFTRTQEVTYTDRFTMVATTSDIERGWPGAGNIDLDPLFAGGGDYHLQSGSPAIDQVDPVTAPPIDLDGVGRPMPYDGLADMGCYEWFLYKVYLPLVLRNSP